MKRILILAAALICMAAHGQEVLVEAESFAETGGWQIDQQFMDVMGSPYLIAHGAGVPVGAAWLDEVKAYEKNVLSKR